MGLNFCLTEFQLIYNHPSLSIGSSECTGCIFEDSATITDLEMGGRSSENQRYSGIMKSEFADSRLNKQIKNTHFKIIFYGLARFSSAEQTISLQGCFGGNNLMTKEKFKSCRVSRRPILFQRLC